MPDIKIECFYHLNAGSVKSLSRITFSVLYLNQPTLVSSCASGSLSEGCLPGLRLLSSSTSGSL